MGRPRLHSLRKFLAASIATDAYHPVIPTRERSETVGICCSSTAAIGEKEFFNRGSSRRQNRIRARLQARRNNTTIKPALAAVPRLSRAGARRKGTTSVVPTEIRMRCALAPEICFGGLKHFHPRLAGGTIPLCRKYTAICP